MSAFADTEWIAMTEKDQSSEKLSDSDLALASGLDNLFINHERTGRPIWRGGGFMEMFFPNGCAMEQRIFMIDIWEDYFSLFKDSMTHFLKNDANRLSPITDHHFPEHFREILPSIGEDEWFDGRLVGYVNAIRTGEPTPYAIEGAGAWSNYRDKLSSISAYFHSSWYMSNTDLLIATLLKWCARIKPRHGLSGLGMVRDFGSPPYSQRDSKMFPFLKRFPGLDYTDTAQFNLIAGNSTSIRGVNWLTIVDDGFVEKLGGKEKLANALSQDTEIVVHDYAGGLIIQAGKYPFIGDVNAGRTRSHYNTVAQALKPIRFEDYTDMGYFRVPDPLDEVDETLKWVHRFD